MKDKRPIALGSVVRSKAGRDTGRYFIITQLIDSDFVMMADGGLRDMDRPKRKRKKHLYVTEHVISGLQEKLEAGMAVENHEIRSALRALSQEEA